MTSLPDWLAAELPAPFEDMLLAGTAGRDHLLRAAAMAEVAADQVQGTAREAWAHRRLGLLASAFEEDSLHGPTAAALTGALSDAAASAVRADPAFAVLLETLARTFRIPENTAYYQRLVAAGDARRIEAYLENECRGRHGLFWLHVALRRDILSRNFDRGLAHIALALPEALAPLADKLRADLALLAGRPGEALALYERSLAMAPRPLGRFRAGLAARAAGEDAAARAHFAATLAAMPEHVSAALALYDLVAGRDKASAALPPSVAIALYTYNKGADLDATLASLFASALGQARVTVLDNASADATPDVLAAWVDRVGTGRLATIRLPVNIGAPAARNWLAAVPRVGEADFVAYLDDDVDLPADWLPRLFAAMRAYPEAGVWGCRVADTGNPAVAQGVGAMLVPGKTCGDAPSLPWLGTAHAESFDFGAFTHLRPCLSVMGCCHLFRGERLRAAGGFDIRYSPSQYDDVDHDLRLALSGRPPVYQGHLVVGHRRPAPVFAPPKPDQQAGGEANLHKLLAKHRDRFTELGDGMRRCAREDLIAKWGELTDTAESDEA
ncbi:glycosyl transferase family 2 [Solidesulfovibrio fructosivorans JJ]]|uniref:Glycosyl transferase family 2 n=1 Tax=Solidesulfovibrio fructosivorans JJ] TaxID=596151 RepID=E1JZ24_SOLFR|nr:glycosyltransferase [Solidesulfovibrio fructosivorans]EFL50440.1 glycosyl transferase family 2 [Solidesulfovibrio fructosivorans JJ]]